MLLCKYSINFETVLIKTVLRHYERRTHMKKLNKKTRKLIFSYLTDDISKDYEKVKKIVYNCRKEGFNCYFSIDSDRKLRFFLISSDDWKKLENFSKQL